MRFINSISRRSSSNFSDDTITLTFLGLNERGIHKATEGNWGREVLFVDKKIERIKK